jgi:hypothetical protein
VPGLLDENKREEDASFYCIKDDIVLPLSVYNEPDTDALWKKGMQEIFLQNLLLKIQKVNNISWNSS